MQCQSDEAPLLFKRDSGLIGNPIVHGITASLALSVLYFIAVSYLESFGHAVGTFLSISYLMIPLIVGFGAQVALFSSSRRFMKSRSESTSMTASGGLSAGSMTACCAHHVTDVLPLIGLTAAASFLTAFQPVFLTLGIFANVLGALTIVSKMKDRGLYDSKGFLARIMSFDLKKIRYYSIIPFAIIMVAVIFVTASGQGGPLNGSGQNVSNLIELPPKKAQLGDVEVTVSPLPFSRGQDLSFKIAFDTHVGSLDFDVTKSIYLDYGTGGTSPLGWNGTQPGGHHREVTVTFQPLPQTTSLLRLLLEGISGQGPQYFEWRIDSQ